MDQITLDRERLRLGKYFGRYAKLTSDQMYGLLWLLGEWSIRADEEEGKYIGNEARSIAARKALLEFHMKPLTLDQAMRLMRDAS